MHRLPRIRHDRFRSVNCRSFPTCGEDPRVCEVRDFGQQGQVGAAEACGVFPVVAFLVQLGTSGIPAN